MATTLAGYSIGSVPRFETTSAAVYGRFTRAKRGVYRGVTRVDVSEIEQTFHQRSTSATSARNAAFSVDMAVDEGGEGGLERSNDSKCNLSVGEDQVPFPNLEQTFRHVISNSITVNFPG